MELRPTTAEDLPALYAIFLRALSGLFEPLGLDSPATPYPVFELVQRHVRETGTSVVAIQDGSPVGFGACWARGDDWFLASLFVDPNVHGSGVGATLLDAIWGSGYARRRTITDAIQPVSNALYARRGLVPTTPILDFYGRPLRRPTTMLEAGDGPLEHIDRAAYGFERAQDHALWRLAAPPTVWHRAGAPVAYSYRLGSTVGPVAGLDAESAAQALDAELGRADEPVRVRIPGSCRRLVEVALAHRLRLTPAPGLLLLSEDARPPDALAVGGYTLF